MDDAQLAWPDISRIFRLSMVSYGGKVVALPLTPVLYFTYFNKRIFERDNLTVPQTWEEFADMVGWVGGWVVAGHAP